MVKMSQFEYFECFRSGSCFEDIFLFFLEGIIHFKKYISTEQNFKKSRNLYDNCALRFVTFCLLCLLTFETRVRYHHKATTNLLTYGLKLRIWNKQNLIELQVVFSHHT